MGLYFMKTIVFRYPNLKVFVPYDLISRAWDKLYNNIRGKEYDLRFEFKKPLKGLLLHKNPRKVT